MVTKQRNKKTTFSLLMIHVGKESYGQIKITAWKTLLLPFYCRKLRITKLSLCHCYSVIFPKWLNLSATSMLPYEAKQTTRMQI